MYLEPVLTPIAGLYCYRYLQIAPVELTWMLLALLLLPDPPKCLGPQLAPATTWVHIDCPGPTAAHVPKVGPGPCCWPTSLPMCVCLQLAPASTQAPTASSIATYVHATSSCYCHHIPRSLVSEKPSRPWSHSGPQTALAVKDHAIVDVRHLTQWDNLPPQISTYLYILVFILTLISGFIQL